MFSKRCKKCLITKNYPKAHFDEQGVCNCCRGEKDIYVTLNLKKHHKKQDKLRKDFETTIQKVKGDRYDCIVGISGGKDSIYLLWLLTQKYHLTCLALTVDNGLLSSYAKKNISCAVNKLNMDHILYKPSPQFYKKLYLHLLRNPNNFGYMESVCSICSELFLGTALKTAVEKNIPLICFGYTPDQITKYLYEIPKSELRKNRFPKKLQSANFTKKEREYFWTPSKYQIKDYPRILFPYHVIEYPGVSKIEHFLHKKQLITISSPLLTNCYLSWLTLLLDLKKNGYNPLSNNYSELIRKEKALRGKWYLIFRIGELLLKKQIIKRKEIQNVLNFLDISLGDF